MVKGFKPIHGKEPILKAIHCAVEYEAGELYHDRAGQFIRQLNKREPDWLRDTGSGGKHTQLMNPARGLILSVSSSATGLTYSTEGRAEQIAAGEIASFAAQAALVIGVAVDEFELPDFQRVGYREQYYFTSETLEESEKWLFDLGLVNANESLFASFGKRSMMSWAITFEGEECRYRLELRGRERPATVPVGPSELSMKHSGVKHLNRTDLLKLLALKRDRQVDPEYATFLDIDAFLWGDTDPDFDVQSFIERRASSNLEMFRKCVK